MPGSWVRILGKTTSPKMQVVKYVTRKKLILGAEESDSYLECVWCENGERKLGVFHQDKLSKLAETKGLYHV